MWLPGHIALAMLLCAPVILLARRSGIPFIPTLVIVFFFAIMPDFFHLGSIRMISHSLVGLAAVGSIGLLVLHLAGARRITLVIASIAVSSHLLGDYLIGHIYPYFPFSETTAQLNSFNTSFDLRIEIVISVAALVVICMLAVVPKAVTIERNDTRRILVRLMAYGTTAMGIAELGLFLLMDLGNRRLGVAPLLAPLFLMPLGLLVALEIGAWRSALTK